MFSNYALFPLVKNSLKEEIEELFSKSKMAVDSGRKIGIDPLFEITDLSDDERIKLFFLIDEDPSQLFDAEKSCLLAAVKIDFQGGFDIAYRAMTSLMTFLVGEGAGIGNTDALHYLDLKKMRPQVLVGAKITHPGTSVEPCSMSCSEDFPHVFRHQDVNALFEKGKLSPEDVGRMKRQVDRALKSGKFEADVRKELQEIDNALYRVSNRARVGCG